MPSGRKTLGQEQGFKTRFNGDTAAEMGRRGAAAKRAMRPLKMCLRGIATEALYGKPPMDDAKLKPVAEFFGIQVDDVTFAHLAIFKQSVEMAKGDAGAFNLVAAYAGEKPTENLNITTSTFEALDEAFAGLKDDTAE